MSFRAEMFVAKLKKKKVLNQILFWKIDYNLLTERAFVREKILLVADFFAAAFT